LRFRLDGNIFSAASAMDATDASLYQHGDNPGQPGYILEELLTKAQEHSVSSVCVRLDYSTAQSSCTLEP
jgi:hypothetical protein